MGSTLGPNSGPRAGVILTHPNSFPILEVLENTSIERNTWLIIGTLGYQNGYRIVLPLFHIPIA
jgi:hypothetical protein